MEEEIEQEIRAFEKMYRKKAANEKKAEEEVLRNGLCKDIPRDHGAKGYGSLENDRFIGNIGQDYIPAAVSVDAARRRSRAVTPHPTRPHVCANDRSACSYR